ncbi:MAG: hypothetical protein KDJ47_06800 [Hyphomicrobiaceae bacterium]|nr:hypothetical protein [Hyphomicrobiaceae bacterium]
MSFFKKTILVAAALFLLPKDQEQQQRFSATATEAISWAATYCQRNPWQCQQAEAVYVDLKERATFGFGLVYGLAVERMNAGRTEVDSTRLDAAPRPDTAPRRRDLTSAYLSSANNTLTPKDIMPRWRGALEK